MTSGHLGIYTTLTDVTLAVRSVFSVEKKLSIAELATVTRTSGVPMAWSQTLTGRPDDGEIILHC